MNQDMYSRILALAAEKTMQEKTVDYLAAHLGKFIEPGETALICFPTNEKGGLGDLMGRAVASCGGCPRHWGEDHRWKNLLRLAFSCRATTIIGTPLVVLGLSKLKKASGIPLFIQNVVTAGYPCTEWMKDGIRKGFDCRLWSSFGVFLTGIVAGFSCGRDVHLWTSEYKIETAAPDGTVLPVGELGRWVLSPRSHPELRICPGEFGRLETGPCPCGASGDRITDLRHWNAEDRELADIAEMLLSWTSILDCSVVRGHYGLELELVVFPGEKLPMLPSCARQVIRPWNPERDKPFLDVPVGNNISIFIDSH